MNLVSFLVTLFYEMAKKYERDPSLIYLKNFQNYLMTCEIFTALKQTADNLIFLGDRVYSENLSISKFCYGNHTA